MQIPYSRAKNKSQKTGIGNKLRWPKGQIWPQRGKPRKKYFIPPPLPPPPPPTPPDSLQPRVGGGKRWSWGIAGRDKHRMG